MGIKSFLNTIMFGEIMSGLKLTFRHMFKKAVTLQYPHEKLTLPDGYRGFIVQRRYENEQERCVGCDLCEAICPAKAISVVGDIHPEFPDRRYAKEYTLDFTRCIFCGFCVVACPVNALAMTKEYAHSSFTREGLIYSKEQLLTLGDKCEQDSIEYLKFKNMWEAENSGKEEGRYHFPPIPSVKSGG
ncbi:MAG: NADH-quinone oxidoreductase subunit NuoI [Leptospirillum sp.]|jgi:NADH-quinone oxidoreductase subunit I